MDSQGTQQVSVAGSVKTGRRSAGRRRQPYAWLGAGALTLGVGVALAGAGTAHADDGPSVDSAGSAKASAPTTAAAPRGAVRTPGNAARGVGDRSATARTANKRVVATAAPSRSAAPAAVSRRLAATTVDSRTATVAVPTAATTTGPITKKVGLWGAAVQIPPRAGTTVIAAGAPRLENVWGPNSLNPARFGPVLAPVVWALNEAQYQLQGLTPLAKPNQLPAAPGQAQIVGTLNTVSPFGAPVKFEVTNAPANGTVNIDSQGFYTYTPNAALAATGGTDTFAVTATDAGFHLENLFGLPGHKVTMTVPVKISPQSAQSQVAADLTTFTLINTSWATQTVTGTNDGFGSAVVVPATGTALQTAQSAVVSFQYGVGAFLDVWLRSAAGTPAGTLTWPANNGSSGNLSLTFLDLNLFSPDLEVGCYPTSGSCSFPAQPANNGGSIYFADAPGTVYTVPAADAQQQSDVLQNLVADDLSNAVFYPKGQPTIGYTNPLKAQGFSPYTNNTLDNSTNTYSIAQTTSATDSSQYNVSVKVTEEVKLGLLTSKAELGAQYTWGTTTTNTLTYTQSTTQTVRPGNTLYLYTETPVYRYYGDWSVVYGNTTYILNDVWFDSPNPVTVSYPSYLAAYTCEAGSADCAQLAAGTIPASYPNAFPASPNYPVAESPSANAAVSSNQAAQRQRWGRPPAVTA